MESLVGDRIEVDAHVGQRGGQGGAHQGARGDILDPDNGTVYRCKARLAEGGKKLVVRGYIGISLIGRSQTWTREP